MARSISTAYAIQNAAFMQNEEEYVNQYNLNRFFPQAHEEFRGREIRFLDQTFAPPMNLDQLAFHNLSAESQSSSSSSSSPSSDRSTPLVGPIPFHPSFPPQLPSQPFQPLQHFQPIPHFVPHTPSPPTFARPSNIVVMGPNGPINPNTRLTTSHCPSPSYSNYGGGGGGGQSTTPKFAPSALRHAAAAAAAAANAAAAAAAANHKPKPSLQRANSLSRLPGRKKSPAARPSSTALGSPAHYGSQYELGPDGSNRSHFVFRPNQLGANQPGSIQFISNQIGSNATLFDAPKKRFQKSFTDLQLQNSLNRNNNALAHSTPNLASAPKYFCAPDFDVSLKPANYPQALLLPNQAHQQPCISRSQYFNYSQSSSSSSFDDEAPLDLSGPPAIKPNKQQQFYRSNPDISISLVDAPKVKRQPQPKQKPQSQPKLQPQPKPQSQPKLQPQLQPQQLEGLANHLSAYRSPSPSPSHFVARIQKQKQAMEKLAKQASALASASTPVRILANDIVPGTTRQPPDVLRQRLGGATSSQSTSAAAESTSSHDQNLIPSLIVHDNPISNAIINSKSSQTTNKVIAKTVSIPKEFATTSSSSSTVNKGPGHTSPPIRNVQMLSETRIKIISEPSQQQTIINASAESNLESQASGSQSMSNELAEPKDKSQEGNKRKNKGKSHHHRKSSATSPSASTPSAPTSPTEALPKVRINVKTNRIIPCGSPTSSTSANEAIAASPPTSQAVIEPKGANQEKQKDGPSIVAMETDGGESVVAISPSSSSSVSELLVAMPANRTAPATNPFESLVAVAARLAETDQHQTSARQNSGLTELTNREEQAAIELLNLRTVAITSTSNTVTTASQTDSSVPLIPHCTLLVMANPSAVGASSTGANKTPELIFISDDDNDSIHEKQDVTGNEQEQQQLNAVAQPIVAIDQQQPVGINQQQPKFADCNIDPIEANNNVNDDNLPVDLPVDLPANLPADLPADLPQSHEQHPGDGEFLPFTTNVDHNEPLVVLHGEDLPSVMSYYDEVEKVTKHFFLIAKKDERHNIRWMQTQLGNGNGSAPVRVVPTLDACKRVRVFDESAIVTISDSEDDDESAAPEPQSAKRKRGRPRKGGSRVRPSTASTSAQPVGPPLKRMRDA